MAKSTKQLARELGLLRKRPLSVRSPRLSRKKQKTNQAFSHLIIIDFESTCWENERHTPQEIIEFPAVLLNTTTGQIESEFHHYLQPSERPTLSEFCHQLTGITQSQVDNGIPLSLCLRKFTAWLRKLREDKGIVCADDKTMCNIDVSGTKIAAFVTWSDWDLGVCLFYEAKRKQITKPSSLDRWIDLRLVYRKFYSRQPGGLNGALKDLGIQFNGREHSGLDDARNTARLAWRMMCDGCQMAITKTLKMTPSGKIERISPPNVPQVLTCIKPRMDASHTSRLSVSPEGKTICIGSEKTPCTGKGESPFNTKNSKGKTLFVIAKDKQISPQRKTKENHLCKHPGLSERNLNVEPPQNLPSMTKTSKLSTSILPKSPQCSVKTKQCSPSKIPVLKPNWTASNGKVNGSNLLTKVYEGDRYQPLKSVPSSIAGNVKTPDSSSDLSKKSFHAPAARLSTCKSPATKPNLSSTATVTANLTSNFKTPRVSSTTTNRFYAQPCPLSSVASTSLSSVSSASSHAFRTPTNICGNSIQTSTTLPSKKTPVTSVRTPHNFKANTFVNMKVTPPLCTCGRRSRRRLVQNQGPNVGRWFFSCSRGRPAGGDGDKSGCGFFQWESPSNDGIVRSDARKPFTPLFHPPSSSQRSLGIRSMSRIKFRSVE